MFRTNLIRTFSSASARSKAPLTPFHLAFPVRDIEKAKHFYGDLLKCPQGREDPGKWCDFDLFGHQIVCHQVPKEALAQPKEGVIAHNQVDSHNVPVPHFGIVLEWNAFHEFADLLKSKDVKFEIEPTVRFKGLPGEQSTMFFLDPSGNALEFKSFKDPKKLFATQ
ncbi:glyoxalase/bleomycin resistance protein/dioxygenase superfamily protein [Chytridium lagenaria]|nr:glyoxalase/bleomycin resistance protein/dioxygenase superfamily protein [Chytridium lagenaria]